MIAEEHVFESREALAAELADNVAAALNKGISKLGRTTLAVSGGTTPKLFFEQLSQANVPWQQVTVTLVDERGVPESSPRSNARLVRQHLLNAKAAAACFVPLFDNPDAAKLHLDIVILGMGTDGHTASYFPGGDRLATALDPATPERVIEINAPGAGEPRLTFTLAALLEAQFLCLHIEGREKRRALAKAIEAGPEAKMPIRAVLNSATPLRLYWCP